MSKKKKERFIREYRLRKENEKKTKLKEEQDKSDKIKRT